MLRIAGIITFVGLLLAAGQHLVISGENVIARHNAAVETAAEQLSR